jgi:hypothetical protein
MWMSEIRELEIQKIAGKRKPNPGTDIADIIEKEKKERAAELDRLKLERMVEEEKQKIRDLRGKGNEKAPDVKLANDLLANILQLANVDPQKAAEFIKQLSEEDVRKLSILMASGGSGAAAWMALAKNPSSDVKTLIEAAKMLQPQPQQQITLEGISALFKTAFEAAEKKNQEPPVNPAALIKDAVEMVKPFYESLAQKDREVWEARLRQLEERIINPREWLESIRQDAQLLGFTPSGVDKEIEKIKIDHEKWKTDKEFEFKRWMMEQELENRKWEQIGQIMQGPLGEVIKKFGSAGAERIRGGAAPSLRVETVTCPKCGKPFYANSLADYAVCPFCAAVLQKAQENAPAQNVPSQNVPAENVEVGKQNEQAQQQTEQQE